MFKTDRQVRPLLESIARDGNVIDLPNGIIRQKENIFSGESALELIDVVAYRGK
jgi:hypothetical protein